MIRILTSWLGAVLLLGALLLAPRGAIAAPDVRCYFPAGAERGKTVEVAAIGKFATWPVGIWIDRPGLEMTPLEKQGMFSVRVAADARPGIYWVRLHDESGSAVPHPFVVGTTSELVETEPNNTLDAAQRVGEEGAPSTTVVMNGQLKGGGDVDLFAVPAKAGQWLVADLDAHVPLDAPFDAVMQLISPEGFVQAQNDDHQGLDPRLAFKVPYDGRWHVRLFGFPATPNSTIGFAGDDAYTYRLLLTTGPFVDYTWPMAISQAVASTVALQGWNLPADLARVAIAPTAEADLLLEPLSYLGATRLPAVAQECLLETQPSSLESPQTLPIPCTVSGRIEATADKDVYALAVEKGARLSFRVESRELGYDLDPVLELIDAEGKQLAKADDMGASRDAELTYTAAVDGVVRLVIADLHRAGGERFIYRLTIERATPNYRLVLDAHQLVLPAAGTVELPVKIERLHGHAESIAVTVDGLLAGITATTATSQPGDDSKAKVTLLISAAADAALASGPLRVLGSVEAQPPQSATITVPGHASVHLSDLWLTVIKAAEKK